MDLHERLEHYHEEHEEILRFLGDFENALACAESKSVEERRAALTTLRAMEPRLREIREHCAEEEQNLGSPFQLYLDDSAMETLEKEHQVLDELSVAFCAELEVLTMPPPTQELVRQGREFLRQLCHHIAFEEGLLKQIKDGREAEEKLFLRYTQPAE